MENAFKKRKLKTQVETTLYSTNTTDSEQPWLFAQENSFDR
jgi:hypothetical protein